MEHRRLLLAVPEIALTLQPFELAEGGGGVLVEAVGDCLGLLRLTNQDCVTPKHHRHVLDLVPVNPSQDLGPARVMVGQSGPQALRLTLRLILHQNKLIPSPGQHGVGEVGASERAPLLLCFLLSA
uniref:Uncharacterized protein n=1 Tax=Amphilophus citrinellus TaxID=61819 RepID=A0A3Q0S987_AMPCI